MNKCQDNRKKEVCFQKFTENMQLRHNVLIKNVGSQLLYSERKKKQKKSRMSKYVQTEHV